MHHKKIDDFISKTSPLLSQNGYNINNIKPMQYSKKIYLSKNGEHGVFVIYWSKKKGFSFVNEGNFNNKEEVLSIFSGKPVIYTENKNIDKNNYIGMDESGKGDYFGPLVVCGFDVTKQNYQALSKTGVKDCKKLSDKKVKQVYSILKSGFKDFYKQRVIMPEEYNNIISEFSLKNKKLNHVLGNIYAELITRFNYTNRLYLIDRFGNERFINEFLTDNKYDFVLKEKAETYLGVAAASVVARAVFLEKIEELSLESGIDIPLGAGEKADITAKKLYSLQGEQGLKSFVKFHFKNTHKIREN